MAASLLRDDTVHLRKHDETFAKIEASSDKDAKHSFIVQLRAGCASHCHNPLMEILTTHRYAILGADRAAITASLSEMRELKRLHGDKILDFGAVVAEAKISHTAVSGCAEYWQQQKQKTQKKQGKSPAAAVEVSANGEGEGIAAAAAAAAVAASQEEALLLSNATSFTIVTSAMSANELTAFMDELAAKGVEDKQLEFALEYSSLRPDKRNVIIVTITTKDEQCILGQQLAHTLASRREIEWVERRYDIFPLNRWAKGICQTANYQAQPMTIQRNLQGTCTGPQCTQPYQVIGISDTGIDHTSCYFKDPNVRMPFSPDGSNINQLHRKVVQYTCYRDCIDDDESHGTHVSGTVAGVSTKNYGDFIKYNGHATTAKVSFFDIGTTCSPQQVSSNTCPAGLYTPSHLDTDMFLVQYNAGARVFSESWGSSSNEYTTNSQLADVFLFDYPDAMINFAMGNTGKVTAFSDGSMGSPATAKNIVSVGATLTANQVFKAFPNSVPDGVTGDFTYTSLAYFSSRGPTGDATPRIKPDIVAPGWWTTSAGGLSNSTSDHCTIKTMQGTSMATPAVSGNMALVRDYYTSGFYPTGHRTAANAFNPSGALLKATVIHSGTTDMTKVVAVDRTSGHTTVKGLPTTGGVVTYPSSDIGYGRIDLSRVLNFFDPNGVPDVLNTVTFPYPVPAVPLTLFVQGGATKSDKYYVELSSTTPSGTTSTTTKLTDRYIFKTIDQTTPLPPMRITLAWTDIASTSGFNSGTIYNVLDVFAQQCTSSACTSFSQTFRTYTASASNFANNVGMIDIAAPVANAYYLVTVQAGALGPTGGADNTALQFSPQPYALVVTGIIQPLNISASDNPYPKYVPPTQPKDYISPAAQTMIAIFGIVAIILGSICLTIHCSHKKADRLQQEEFARIIGDGGHMEDELALQQAVNASLAGGNRPVPQQGIQLSQVRR